MEQVQGLMLQKANTKAQVEAHVAKIKATSAPGRRYHGLAAATTLGPFSTTRLGSSSRTPLGSCSVATLSPTP